MARPMRVEYEGAFDHITARGNERKKFFSDQDYARFVEYFAIAKERFGNKINNDEKLLFEVTELNRKLSRVKG